VDSKILKFIFIGRITHIKGLKCVLEALIKIDKKIVLHIYGQSTEDSYYNECIEIISKSLHDIVLKGVFENCESVNILSSYDALIVPTVSSEMSALVIQEAFAAKTPVIASDLPGNSEHVIPKINGYLFKRNDSNNLAELLENIIDNPDELRSLKKTIVDPQSFKIITQKYLVEYRKLLNN
jgi:glycosyltransferase involved in cell wall biosynthesis